MISLAITWLIFQFKVRIQGLFCQHVFVGKIFTDEFVVYECTNCLRVMAIEREVEK